MILQYNKYILLRLIAPTILISVSLTLIAWLSQSLRFIDLIVNRGLDVVTFLYFSMLLIPSLLWLVIPISLFIAVLYVYHKLTMESEIAALKTAGISRLGLMKPALTLAVFITGISYLIGAYLLPYSYREFKDLQYFVRDNYSSVLLQEGVFTSPSKGLTVYIRERSDDGVLKGILVYDGRKKERQITMMADIGRLIKSDQGIIIELDSGQQQEWNSKTNKLSVLTFNQYRTNLSELTDKYERIRRRKPKERYINELFYPEEGLTDEFKEELRAEAYFRLSWPLFDILLTLIALAVFIMGEYNRRGKNFRMVFGIASAMLIIGAHFTLSSITSNYVAIILPVIFIIGVFLLITKSRKLKLSAT